MIENLIKLLELWRDITRIMSIAYIKDNVDYQKVIDSFKLKIKKFQTTAEKNNFIITKCHRR